MFFALRGITRGPLAWAIHKVFEAFGARFAHKVFLEDGSIYGGVQRGLEASPHRGVIGTREERIYHFQKFVLDKTRGQARELPQAGAGA